jgi:hypothetical protein
MPFVFDVDIAETEMGIGNTEFGKKKSKRISNVQCRIIQVLFSIFSRLAYLFVARYSVLTANVSS